MIPAERALIEFRGEDLFDPEHYLGCNPDVKLAGEIPFDHYLRHGWREGRVPNAMFDDGYYRAQSGLSRDAPVSALAHYLAIGRRRGLCPFPGFDLPAIRRTMPGLGIARIDPYRHLLSSRSDSVATERLDLDQIRLGLKSISARVERPIVDVIVPVYRGAAETMNTLFHLLSAECRTGYAIHVVNDCSPEPGLAEDLRQFEHDGLITLIENASNKGFVASINLGCAANTSRDVVWLNADTEVFDGWIDRLRAAAYSASKVASVTPLTNNGTIASYPQFNTDNSGRLETSWAELDRLAARFNSGQRVSTPTGVGFCMYVRRDALNRIGPLDLVAFGRGYGEENDFCQRAVAAGWDNLIAADVFVRHFGATSFRDSRADRVEAAMKVLDRRFPAYRDDVKRFVSADPLKPLRRKLDLARLGTLSGRRNILMVSHERGGGTEQHIIEETARLEAEGWSVYTMRPGSGGPDTARMSHAKADLLPQLSDLPLRENWLWKALTLLRIERVQIHHLIDFSADAPLIFARRLRQCGIPYTSTVHDYFAACPRINMVTLTGHYCGEPEHGGCEACLLSRGSYTGETNIRKWRRRHGVFLAGARSVRVPDRDVATRLQRYFPDLQNIEIVPHEPDFVPRRAPRVPRRDGPLRLVVIGAIGPIKGYDALLGFARHAMAAELRTEISLVGYSRDDATLRENGVRVTGPYLNDAIQRQIDDVDPDVIWIPSLWPETYCYTLSIALASGRPIAAFDIGAIGTRLRDAGRGHLIPLQLAGDPAALWRHFRSAALSRTGALERLVS